jgi:hypothetical protein
MRNFSRVNAGRSGFQLQALLHEVEGIEDLGYDRAWVPDSQMIWSDCYATLALAAVQAPDGDSVPRAACWIPRQVTHARQAIELSLLWTTAAGPAGAPPGDATTMACSEHQVFIRMDDSVQVQEDDPTPTGLASGMASSIDRESSQQRVGIQTAADSSMMRIFDLTLRHPRLAAAIPLLAILLAACQQDNGGLPGY